MSDSLIGTTLGPYKILEPLGAGGMGEVYVAEDTRLHRRVAVKVLHAGMADDPSTIERFQSEARAVAALSHPNILEIYDVGVQDGVSYAVSELLEGETIAELLAEGPLPPRTAIDYARQAALGLSAAHAQGIVHRDIKPSNLFVTRDGRLKILDFGLAKARETHVPASDASVQLTIAHTEPGTVMGTVGYMAPEQVRGESAEKCADLFSLGVVLYEMLGGSAPFHRDTSAETMTAILREDAPPLHMEAAVPAALERVLLRCLEKRPQDRFQSARDLAFALDNSGSVSGPAAVVEGPESAAPSAGTRWPLIVGMILLALAAGWLAGRGGSPPNSGNSEPPRSRMLTYSGADFQPAASPDGRMLAFVSTRRGRSEIWLRQLAGGGEQVLTTAAADTVPRFAPDGSSVLFGRSLPDELPALYRIALVGGQPRKMIDDADEGDWAPDGSAVAFLRATHDADTMLVLDLETESERELFSTEGWDLRGIRYAPDGKTIAVTRAPLSDGAGGFAILLVDVASGDVRELGGPASARNLSIATWVRDGGALVYAASESTTGDRTGIPGRVVLHDLASGAVRNLLWADGLFQQRGDSSLTAQVEVLGEQLIVQTTTTRQALYEVALDGDAVGRLGVALTTGQAQDRQPAYSPDGSRILFSSNRSGNLDLWELDRATGLLTQVTEDAAQDWDPAYTVDGESILWSSDRGGTLEIWTANRDGSDARQVSHIGSDAQNPGLIPGRNVLVYGSTSSTSSDGWGLYRVDMDGDNERLVYGQTISVPEPAPDGRWIAVSTNSVAGTYRALSGTSVIFVDPDTGELALPRVDISSLARVSSASFGRPRWFRDGRFAYIGHVNGRLGILAVELDMGSAKFAPAVPLAGFLEDMNAESFDVSPDGKHVVISYERPTVMLSIVDHIPALRQAGE